MSKQIPVWRTLSHDIGGSRQCQWSLVPMGHLTVAQSAHADGSRPLRIWSSDVEAFVSEVSTVPGLVKDPKILNGKMNYCWSAKENLQPDILDVKSQHLNITDEKLNHVSPHKRGILTMNSEACNGSITTFKRRRRFEVPSKKYDVENQVCSSLRKPALSLSNVTNSDYGCSAVKEGTSNPVIANGRLSWNEKETAVSTKQAMHLHKDTGKLSSEFGNKQLNQDHMKNEGISFYSEKQSVDPEISLPTPEYLLQTATENTLYNAGMGPAIALFRDRENLGSDFDGEDFYTNKGDNGSGLASNKNVSYNQCHDDKGNGVNEQRCILGSLFQTASGKSVLISKTAIKRAMSLFTEDTSSFQQNETKVPNGGLEMKRYSEDDLCLQTSISAPLFQTSSEKPVSMSESGMEQANALLDEEENAHFGVCRNEIAININAKEPEIGPSSSCHISKIKYLGTNVSENGIWDPSIYTDNNIVPNGVPSDNQCLYDSTQDIRYQKSMSLCLFQTGSGKPVSISESAMKRAQTLFDDRESFQAGDYKGKMNAGNGPCLPDIGATKNKFENRTPASGSLFQTAAGKSVSVSEAGMKRALKLFSDAEVSHPQHQTCNAAALTRFDDNISKFENPMPDSGSLFKPAAGKNVSVSQAGMKRAMELLSDAEVHPFQNQPCTGQRGFAISEYDSSIHRKHEPECGNILSFSSITKHSNDNFSKLENQIVAPGYLFQTAAGEKVSITETGMKRAIELLGDVEGYAKATTGTSSGKQHVTSSVSMIENRLPASGSLFQTAAGKNVSISEAGMKRAMELFSDEEASIAQNGTCKGEIINTNLDSDSSSCKKHKPESGLSINVSTHKTQNHTPASGCLFQTAAGNKVCVPEAGMKQATELSPDAEVYHVQNQTSSSDMDYPISDYNFSSHKKHDQPPQLSNCSTPQGHSVSLSRSTIQLAAKTLGKENHSFTSSISSRSQPIRLLEERGKALSVSSSAMKRARDLLSVDNRKFSESMHKLGGLNGDSQQLFETEGGHIIKVSSGSIERAKVLLGESSFNTVVPDRENEQLPISSVQGFPMNKNCQKVSRLPIQIRKGAAPRKFVASFKAPRRLHPGVLSATASMPMEVHKQLSEPDYLQLVKMLPLNWKQKQRKSISEFFNQQPHQDPDIRLLSREVQNMTAETAKSYKLYTDVPGFESIGSDEFRQMLRQAGLNSEVLTKEWVDNHFRWIVWKLASFERSYIKECANKFLTIQTVFDELRYRYEREVNSAHRSALKKVTEGDATAGTMMTLCVATICQNIELGQVKKNSDNQGTSLTNDVNQAVDIELTDGWYSIIAQLDQPLVRQLRAGKIFTGQKLRIFRATLVGCTTPMPPLEAFSSMKLAIHINGTYRAHWGDKLGFCKGTRIPIALHCIRHDGGLVPRTVIAINRIYPILYYERLPENRSVTRCARAEELAMRGYQHRRSQIAEDAILRIENDGIQLVAGKNVEEGEKLFQALESSAEPELLMADMTAAEHAAFAAYQSKRQAARQELIEKQIKKALGEKCLDMRDVTPFVRVNVIGVKYDGLSKTAEHQKLLTSTKEGIVTIWQVSEEQVDILNEGGVYYVSDLYPSIGKPGNRSSNRNILHLRSTKSTMWQLISKPRCSSFSPRSGIEISGLGNIPFSSEFDAAVLVLHVGKPYGYGLYQRQWLFVSDGTVEANVCEEIVALLAIDICMPNDAFISVEKSLEGSVIGYCNLVKRHRDQKNSLWVSEASENAVFSSNLSARSFAHLRVAAEKVNKWSKSSAKAIKHLQERVKMAIGREN